ncbi:hypothetical protein IFR05_002732 [Cadophora sp. M221]|nr:hypothetical protein IFR05_002732 [Cadophora sp. M221]
MPTKTIIQRAEKFRASSPTIYDQQYLLGVRGLLVIQAFFWVFLETFVPVAVYNSKNTSGALFQVVLRKGFSVIFWNDHLLYGAIIFLSARSLAIPFIRDPSKSQIARSVFTRGLSFWFPLAISLAIIKIAFSQTGVAYIFDFKKSIGNDSMHVPYVMPNALAYFNSVFNLLWVTHDFSAQSGSTAFPSGTLWMMNVVYMQSYTVYMTMVIIPYTRRKWRVQAAFFFVLTAWWCQSWAWFTISGLLFADMVMTMDFKACSQRGIPINVPLSRLRQQDGSPYRIPVWVPATFCVFSGLLMQYLWIAWRPDLWNREFFYHSALYYTADLNYDYANRHTPARNDIYLILVGFFLFLESYEGLQRCFDNKFLVYLGKRSMSFFLIQSTIIYLVGIKLFMRMQDVSKASFSGSVIVTLITCLIVIVPLTELFHRAVVMTSKAFSHICFDFITS